MRLDKLFASSAVTRTLADGLPIIGAFATTSVAIGANFIADDTVTIAGDVYTFKAVPNSAYEVTLGGSANDSIANLNTLIANGNGYTPANTNVLGTVDGGDWVLTALTAGIAGNDFTVESTVNDYDGLVFAGGVDPETPVKAGQLCVYGENTNKLTFIAYGDTSDDWALIGPENVIEDPNNPGSFIEITIDGDEALGHQPYNLNV